MHTWRLSLQGGMNCKIVCMRDAKKSLLGKGRCEFLLLLAPDEGESITL